MMRHPRSDRGERELPGPLLCVCDQLHQRMDRKRRIDDQYERYASEPSERNEIGCRVVGQLLVERDVDRHRGARRHEQQVAVGGGFGDGARRDEGAPPRRILDHERLAEPLLQSLAEHAGNDVRAPARSERHDDGDGARRVVLCPRQRRDEKTCAGGARSDARIDGAQGSCGLPLSNPCTTPKGGRWSWLLTAPSEALIPECVWPTAFTLPAAMNAGPRHVPLERAARGQVTPIG